MQKGPHLHNDVLVRHFSILGNTIQILKKHHTALQHDSKIPQCGPYGQWHHVTFRFITTPYVARITEFQFAPLGKSGRVTGLLPKTLWQIIIKTQAFLGAGVGILLARLTFNPSKSCQVSFNLLTANYMFLHPSVWGLSFSVSVLLSVSLTITACDIHNTNQILILCTPETVNIILCFALSLKHSGKIFA